MTNPGPDPRQDLGSWSVVAGNPLTITLTIKNPDGSAVNLTAYGSAWSATARRKVTDTTPTEAFVVDSTSAATGVLVLSLTAAQTTAMVTSAGDATTWRFDLKATGGAVTPQTPFKGTVVVERTYTP